MLAGVSLVLSVLQTPLSSIFQTVISKPLGDLRYVQWGSAGTSLEMLSNIIYQKIKS